MTIQELGSLGELVGAIATVVTLIYLALQIRTNTQAVRSSAAQSVHEAFAIWYRMLAADADLAKITADGLEDYSSLSDSERARFVATFMAFLSCSQDAFIKWHEGALAEELWSGWEQVMMNLFIAPGGRTFWEQRGYLFGDEFRRYIDEDLMKREAHPEARPMGLFPLQPVGSQDGPVDVGTAGKEPT